MKLKTIASSLLFVVASVAAGVSSAAVQTFSASTPISTSDVTYDLILNKFDTSLGQLDAITFWIEGSATTTLTLTNNKAKKTPDVSITAGLAATLPGVAGSLSTPSATTVHFNQQMAKNETQTVSGTAALSSSVLTIDAAYFSLFKGNATDTLLSPLSLNAFSVENNVTNIDILKQTSGSATAYISYSYTAAPVPEPETYGMLLLGMGVVAFAAKRKSRSAQA
ncbi:choice-of-anchor E domain-containing protein [Duganella sp. PWIR1]